MLDTYSETEIYAAVDKLLQLCSSGVEQIKYVSRFESFANKIQAYAGIPKPKESIPTFSQLSSRQYSSLDKLGKELYWLYYKHVFGEEKFKQQCSVLDEDFLYGGYPENSAVINKVRSNINKYINGNQ